MKRSLVLVAALSLLSAPAMAGSYRILLSPPQGGRLLIGHAGVQAADERNDKLVIRVISPGNEVKQRGTLRFLVMNLGEKPFEVGPDEVKLQLADGTVFQPTPMKEFDKSAEMIEREARHAHAIDLQNRESLSAIAEQASNGPASQPGSPEPAISAPSAAGDASGLQNSDSSTALLGDELLDDLNQLLVPLTVGPKQAWGGYYVFDVPKSVFDKRADQPLTIMVKTGAEEHRFSATLHWK